MNIPTRVIISVIVAATLGGLIWIFTCDCHEQAPPAKGSGVAAPEGAQAPQATTAAGTAPQAEEPKPAEPPVAPSELCRRFGKATKDHARMMTHIRMKPLESFRQAVADTATTLEAAAAAVKALDTRHDELGPAFIEYRLVLEGMARDYRRIDERPADEGPVADDELRKRVKRNDLSWQVPWSTIESICQPILHGG